MKTLTVRQPYAGLIAAGMKHYETRPPGLGRWFRGDLMIHAATWTRNSWEIVAAAKPEVAQIPRLYGVILCIVQVVEIVPVEEVRDTISPFEHLVGDYHDGRLAWVLENVRLLPEPIAAKGQLGLWNWNN